MTVSEVINFVLGVLFLLVIASIVAIPIVLYYWKRKLKKIRENIPTDMDKKIALENEREKERLVKRKESRKPKKK